MTKQTLIIHAGTRKTGTTAIQEYLFRHLDHPDFEYFSAGIVNGSMIINRAFSANYNGRPGDERRILSKIMRALDKHRARKRFVSCLAKYHKKNVILSAESISSLRKKECADLLELVMRQFDQVKVVIYFRPARTRMESAYQESLKHRFVSINQRVPINLRHSVSKFDKVFGKENVTLRLFAPSTFPNGSVVNDFLSLIGVEGDPVPAKHSNSSLSLQAVQLLYVYRKEFPTAVREDRALIKKLADLEGEKFQLHPDLMDNVIDERNANYDWFESRSGFSLRESRVCKEGAVRGEADLLDIPPSSLLWLLSQIDEDYSQSLDANDLRMIARTMRQLALSLGP